jgi:hypothetical protein
LCGHKAVNAMLTDFEYLTTMPNAGFTTADGFNGGFYGSDTFSVTSDAHSGTHALNVDTASATFIQIGAYYGGCFDLSGFTGITFWAKGSGTLYFNVTGASTNFSLGQLTSTYTQYTVTWAQAGFGPPMITGYPTNGDHQLQFQVSTGTAGHLSLFLDDISFVGP